MQDRADRIYDNNEHRGTPQEDHPWASWLVVLFLLWVAGWIIEQDG